jgi:hypothetical protein
MPSRVKKRSGKKLNWRNVDCSIKGCPGSHEHNPDSPLRIKLLYAYGKMQMNKDLNSPKRRK